MSAPYIVKLTNAELNALRACVSGELENDDGLSSDYMNPLRRVARKLDEALTSRRKA